MIMDFKPLFPIFFSLQEPITTVNEGQSDAQHIEDTYAGKHQNRLEFINLLGVSILFLARINFFAPLQVFLEHSSVTYTYTILSHLIGITFLSQTLFQD